MRRVGSIVMVALLVAPSAATPASPLTSAPAVVAFVPHAGQAVCRGSDGYAAAPGGRRTFLWRPEWLAAEKAAVAADPARAARLRNAADAALARGPYTVTAKTRVADSGDVHDYVSIGPYWWPDRSKPGGLPYLRRDGEVNPERSGEAFDATRMGAFAADVRTLALAYHHLGDRRHAEHAARLLRAWFVDPATRMNPNLTHAQAVPGRSAGRAEGIIDAHRLVPVVESIGLLAPAGTLAEADEAAIRGWFGDLVAWMAQSPNGRAERAKTNNHGIFYDLMVTQFALYAGLDPVAQATTRAFPVVRIMPQVAPDGSLPEEIARTRSWHYAHWTAEGMAQVAMLGECVGLDLWRWSSPDGRGLRATVDWLAGYGGQPDRWPHEDIELARPDRRAAATREARDLLRVAAWGYRNAALGAAAEAVPVTGSDDAMPPAYPSR